MKNFDINVSLTTATVRDYASAFVWGCFLGLMKSVTWFLLMLAVGMWICKFTGLRPDFIFPH